MGTANKFEELQVWQAGRALAVKIYSITKNARFAKDYGLSNQIQRAAVSIVSNIAEGFGRRSNKQLIQFLEIAAGSVCETQSQLYVALDLGYVAEDKFDEIYSDLTRINRGLTKFIQYLRTKPNRKNQSGHPQKQSNH